MQDFINKEEGESQWLPISDLMAVLMMVFLLIAISYMVKVYEEKRKIEEETEKFKGIIKRELAKERKRLSLTEDGLIKIQ